MTTVTPYDLLRRTLTDSQLVEALRIDPQGTLSRLGITDPQESKELREIFTLMYTGAS